MLDYVQIIFLDFVHLENPLFKVIFWPCPLTPCTSYLLVVLRGNLSYGKTVLLNKVACTLEHILLAYWGVIESHSYLSLLCNMCLSFILRYGSVTVLMDTCFRWEDAKGAYLKFINKLIMGHTEIFSYTNTHIHPITHNHSL